MFTVLIISLMAGGMLLGWLVFARLRSPKPLAAVNAVQQAATCVLLFAMGVWLGDNDAFWTQVRTIGIRGVLFALVTVACSVGAAWLVSRLAFRKGEK